jgi:hypothetical protein
MRQIGSAAFCLAVFTAASSAAADGTGVVRLASLRYEPIPHALLAAPALASPASPASPSLAPRAVLPAAPEPYFTPLPALRPSADVAVVALAKQLIAGGRALGAFGMGERHCDALVGCRFGTFDAAWRGQAVPGTSPWAVAFEASGAVVAGALILGEGRLLLLAPSVYAHGGGIRAGATFD